MNKQTKLAMALGPIMMALTGAASAGTCTGPCAVDSAFDPEIYLNNTGVGGLDWEIETNDLGARLVFGAVNGASEPFVIERAGSADTLYVGSGGNVGINNDTPFAPIDIKSTLPRIFMRDTTATTGKSARVTVNEDKLLLEDDSGTDQFVMELTGATTNQLYLDATGAVAIQKANPSSGAAFEVGGDGNVLLENGTEDWVLNTNSNSLWFRNGDNVIAGASAPVRFGNNAPDYSLTLADSGNIGLGLFSASASLHIQKNDAAILVENGNLVTAQRFTAELKNNGGTGFLITDTSQAAESQWQFSSQPNEAFTASFIGTGGPEMQVRKDGAVQFGPGNVVNFALSANGHMTLLHGSATATAHITSSSRDVKKDFEKVNPEGILQKIKNLEITQWRYKNENEKGLHIGPMAEDFYKLFKLGADDKHVVATDMASIALIVAKELQKETFTLKAENKALKKQLEEKTMALESKLKTENKALQKRLTSLEKLVTNLASANGHLSLSGEKVATAK